MAEDYIVGSPVPMWFKDHMEQVANYARIAELEKTLRIYGRHRSNCMIHFRDECTCGWDEAVKVLGSEPGEKHE